MSRKIEETDVHSAELGDAHIITQALPFEKAEDLLPEVVEIFGGLFDRVLPLIASGGLAADDDVMRLLPLLPAIPALAGRLGGGRLSGLAARVLIGTTVITAPPGGEKAKYDLTNRDERLACFEARPDLYLRCILLAIKVTFARFFPGIGRAKGKKTVA